MKRVIFIGALVLLSFALGWIGACIRVQSQASERMARLEKQHANSIADIRKRIYRSSSFHRKSISPEDEAGSERSDSGSSQASVTLSYVGGLGDSDTHFQIRADGDIFAINHGVSRKVGTLDHGRCAEFFQWVIASGLLNYSNEVIEIKRDLQRPTTMTSRNDAPMTKFRIQVPEINADKVFDVDTEIGLSDFPDIVEYQLVSSLEKEILSFLPKDDSSGNDPTSHPR